MALIGAVALVVIGPEKLPRVARTVGALIGKAQRYVADVKAEVNRSMDLEELKKMRETVEDAARNVENSIQTSASDFENPGQRRLTPPWSPSSRAISTPTKTGGSSKAPCRSGTRPAMGCVHALCRVLRGLPVSVHLAPAERRPYFSHVH